MSIRDKKHLKIKKTGNKKLAGATFNWRVSGFKLNWFFGKLKVNWRTAWYSVLIWFLAIAVGGIVILPWFYLILPIVIVLITIFYFKKAQLPNLISSSKRKKESDLIFALGLWVALFWFAVVVALNILEIIGPYYANVGFYFSDSRNWLKYPLILLVPVVYSLFLANFWHKKDKKPSRFSAPLPF